MMVINKAIRDVTNRIPKEILNIAFMSRSSTVNINTTLEEQIKRLVITPIVLADANIVRGMTLTIPVNMCKQTGIHYNSTANYLVIEVPYELTEGKEIMSPLSLMYTFGKMNGITSYNTSGGLALAEKALDGIDTNVGGISTTNLELIGPNSILVHENISTAINGQLRISVENDNNLRNIKPRSALAFSKLVLLAVKAYIYNELVISVDKGFIYGGHDLNKISDTIDKWEDAWDEYDEYLRETWSKVSFMNDSVAFNRHIKSMINPVV